MSGGLLISDSKSESSITLSSESFGRFLFVSSDTPQDSFTIMPHNFNVSGPGPPLPNMVHDSSVTMFISLRVSGPVISMLLESETGGSFSYVSTMTTFLEAPAAVSFLVDSVCFFSLSPSPVNMKQTPSDSTTMFSSVSDNVSRGLGTAV